MAITTANDYALTGTAKERGFLTRLGSRIMESRKRAADRAVAAYLLSLDDEQLEKLGYDRAALERLGPAGYPFL